MAVTYTGPSNLARKVIDFMYICSTEDFTQESSAPDGSNLLVVDETTHTVVGYYVSFNGFWNKM